MGEFIIMNNFLTNKKTKKGKVLLLIILCWLVYSTSYLGKVNYSANITQIIDFYGVTKAQAGTAPTFFFFAYGVGQVFNGLFCKKYNIKWTIFLSLITSSVINLIIAVTTDFSIIKWLWLLNGIVLSILWPTLIRLLSESLPQKSLDISSVFMGTTVGLGTLVIYGLSSVYAVFSKFKLAFYTASFAVMAVAIIWLILYKKAVTVAKNEREAEGVVEKASCEKTLQNTEQKSQRKIILFTISSLCFCAIAVNLIKDGLTTWVPAILKEEFNMSDSISILLTLFLPILAMFGNPFALKVHKKIPDYVAHCVSVFAVISLIIGAIIGSLSIKAVVFMFIGLVAVNFLASSLNSLLTAIFPLYMRDKLNSGLSAGIINGFCYLGSTISSYGLGAIADNFGWTSVFWTLIAFCLASFIVFIVYNGYKAYIMKKNPLG